MKSIVYEYIISSKREEVKGAKESMEEKKRQVSKLKAFLDELASNRLDIITKIGTEDTEALHKIMESTKRSIEASELRETRMRKNVSKTKSGVSGSKKNHGRKREIL